MEKQLKCVYLLSLKEMALRRVAVILLSDSDILASIPNFPPRPSDSHYYRRAKECQETIEDKIKEKISNLELPESLMKQMIDIIRPISLEISRWKKVHQKFLLASCKKISLPVSVKLCWTTAGTINYRKTAEELVHCDKLNFVQRYQIACFYCLEDCIPLLWEELPEERKEYFNKQRSDFSAMEFWWPCILKGDHSKLDYSLRRSNRHLNSFYQWAFEHSAKKGCKTAAEYFFQKLTHEEREASLMRTAHAVLSDPSIIYYEEEKFSEFLCFLLCLMTPEQQMEIFKAQPINVFLCFFNWPMQDLFIENAGLFWTFLPPSSYGDLLSNMAHRFKKPYNYFPKIFQEFFMQSPLDLKKCFVDEGFKLLKTLSIFFKSEDSESMEAIFRNIDAADRVKLVFDNDLLYSFYDNVKNDRWHMVEVCLREATLSKEHRERLKERFKGFLEGTGNGEMVNGIAKRFFEFLDEADASAANLKKAQKRKLENFCPKK